MFFSVMFFVFLRACSSCRAYSVLVLVLGLFVACPLAYILFALMLVSVLFFSSCLTFLSCLFRSCSCSWSCCGFSLGLHTLCPYARQCFVFVPRVCPSFCVCSGLVLVLGSVAASPLAYILFALMLLSVLFFFLRARSSSRAYSGVVLVLVLVVAGPWAILS